MIGCSDSKQDDISGEHELFVPVHCGGLTATLQVGPGGRIVIPVEMREAMGLKQGDSILANLENGELSLVSYAESIRELQAITRKYVPEGVSLVDELIAERRAEAARDSSE